MANRTRKNRVPRRIWILLASFIVVAFLGVFLVRHIYNIQLKPVSNGQQTQIFTVESGATVKEIANQLEDHKLIKSAWALELYVHSKELGSKLQAGTYAFSPSDGTVSIVKTLTKGQVTTNLVTILPGRRIDQVRTDLINSGFAPDAVDAALLPDQYKDLPALAYKPASVDSLEGLLWPESFQKVASTEPSAIIRESLTITGNKLTPELQAAFAAHGLSTYQGLILASIVTQEVSKPSDQAQAAQVFLTRLKMGMMLGSDVTAYYGSVAAGKSPSLTYDSPYNTLKYVGLPPSPISNVTTGSLQTVAYPATTKWLYFVAGDDGTTHFSTNLKDHEALTEKYCKKLC